MSEQEKRLITEFADCVIDIFGDYSFDNEHSDEYVTFGVSELKTYCIEYNLSLKEIRMVHNLFKDIDFNIENWIKITLSITNSIFYFYSQFRDVDKTIQYIKFLQSMHFEYDYSTEVEDYINDIVDYVKKHGTEILKENENLHWSDFIDIIMEG